MRDSHHSNDGDKPIAIQRSDIMGAQDDLIETTTHAWIDSSLLGLRADGQTMLPAEERNRMIAVAAYYKAEQRGFAAGGELTDWLHAEQEIRVILEGVPAGRALEVMSLLTEGG
jgi:hypothetical protein